MQTMSEREDKNIKLCLRQKKKKKIQTENNPHCRSEYDMPF